MTEYRSREWRIVNGESGGLNRRYFLAFAHYLPLWLSGFVARVNFKKQSQSKPIKANFNRPAQMAGRYERPKSAASVPIVHFDLTLPV